MGVFDRRKKTPAEEAERVFDEKFQEEIRNHGRWYFEKIINESGALFKQDLDSVIGQIQAQLQEHATQQLDQGLAQVNVELKGHVTKQLEEKFDERSQALQEAQDAALQSMTDGVRELQQEHQKLSAELQQGIAQQQEVLNGVFEESKAEIAKMKDTQSLALQYLVQSVKSMQEQQQQMELLLQQGIAEQKAMLVSVYEKNMAQIIEHYLVATLGEQFDLKTQLPGIISQMEANKQAIADDMKL